MDKKQKRILLLYQAGPHTQYIFDTFLDSGEDNDYTKAMDLLDS